VDIIVNWDSSVASAPAGFKNSVEYVVNLYDALFTNAATITIAVGYGEIGGQTLAANDLGESGSILYPDATFNGTTVDTDSAENKVLGFGTMTTPDGYVGFSNTRTPFNFENINTAATGQYDFIATVEHEMSEAMGRISNISQGTPTVLDEYRYSAPGVLATASSATAYFSLDRGTTDLGNFNTISTEDLGDWSSSGSLSGDAFAASGTPGTTEPLSAADIVLMQALGYNYNLSIAEAVIKQNPVLSNWVIGSATNFAGLGGSDLFLLKPTYQLGYSEFASTGSSQATVWFTWQSDGAASPENNAVVLDPSSLVTGTSTNSLGHGGQDVSIIRSNGAAATYEFTSSGSVYVSGNVLFSGSGDIVNGVTGTTIEIASGAQDDILLSSGTVVLDNNLADATVTGNSDTVSAGSTATTVILNGQSEIFSGSSDTVTLTAGSSGTISGNLNSIGAGNGVTATLSGNGNYLNWAVNVGTITGGTITEGGTGNNVTYGDSSDLTVTGTSDSGMIGSNGTLNFTTSSSDNILSINDPSANDTVIEDGTHNEALVESGVTATVAGSGNNLSGGSWSTGGTITDGGIGNFVTYGASADLIVTGTYDGGVIGSNGTLNFSTISLGGGVSVGSNVTATLAGSDNYLNGGFVVTGGTIYEGGTGNYVTYGDFTDLTVTGTDDDGIIGSNGTLNFTPSSSNNILSINDPSANDTVIENGTSNVAVVESGVTATVAGSGNGLLGNFGTGGTITEGGTSDTVFYGASADLTVTGINDCGTIGSNGTLTFTPSSSNSDISVGTTVTVIENGTGNIAWAGNNATGTLAGNGNIMTGGSYAVINITGTSDTFEGLSGTVTFATGSSGAVIGSGDVINFNGTVGAGTKINGGNNTITLASGDTITVQGTGEVVTLGASGLMNLYVGTTTVGFISGSLDTLGIVTNSVSQSVSGFNMSHGDQLNLSQILSGDTLTHNLSNLGSFIAVTNSGSNTTLQISGSGASDTIQLTGVGALTLQNLITGNAFVLPPH
jgi:hypothetical protein